MRRSTRNIRQVRQQDPASPRLKSRASKNLSRSPSPLSASDYDAYQSSDASASADDDAFEEPAPKRQKRTTTAPTRPKKSTQIARSQAVSTSIFIDAPSGPIAAAALLPKRLHSLSYHHPQLLTGPSASQARGNLLAWFDSVSTARAMPWRKPWIDPASVPDVAARRAALERRAYEVWISEIMLQQTRVAVVIGYWDAWMARWPTIQDLAAAAPDDVLSAWRGLGYYSRATRIHQAAQMVVADPKLRGLLPETAGELEARVPGVGRYTGGAISAIVFGHPAPMVDGNVLRVLSRQLGVLGDAKADKKVIDTLWRAADGLAQAVARDGVVEVEAEGTPPLSDRPGRWGQALMELGSTICTPKPDCAACPISSTCRAYAEGRALAAQAGLLDDAPAPLDDVEDACHLCEPYQEAEEETTDTSSIPQPAPSQSKGTKQSRVSSFFPPKGSRPKKASAHALELIVAHASRFPLKRAKKAVREEHTLVCAIRHPDGRYLLHRRPATGLLAGLWELPSQVVPPADWTKVRARKALAAGYVASLLGTGDGLKTKKKAAEADVQDLAGSVQHVGEIGCVPWQFSHLKLTMHVHVFELDSHAGDALDLEGKGGGRAKWASVEELDAESMGTGMHKCWTMVKEAA